MSSEGNGVVGLRERKEKVLLLQRRERNSVRAKMLTWNNEDGSAQKDCERHNTEAACHVYCTAEVPRSSGEATNNQTASCDDPSRGQNTSNQCRLPGNQQRTQEENKPYFHNCSFFFSPLSHIYILFLPSTDETDLCSSFPHIQGKYCTKNSLCDSVVMGQEDGVRWRVQRRALVEQA